MYKRQVYEGTIEIGDGLHTNEIGYLPQQTIVQKDFPASVYEVVLSGRLNRMGGSPFYYAEDKKEALRNMERLGITYLKDKCYRELSGGQQQRVHVSYTHLTVDAGEIIRALLFFNGRH